MLPRVVNKLTTCVYPWTTIPLHVEHITGLSNDNLEKQGRFDTNLVSCLASFLARQLARPDNTVLVSRDVFIRVLAILTI